MWFVPQTLFLTLNNNKTLSGQEYIEQIILRSGNFPEQFAHYIRAVC